MRHVSWCSLGAVTAGHNAIRDCISDFASSADPSTEKEPEDLVSSQPRARPADVLAFSAFRPFMVAWRPLMWELRPQFPVQVVMWRKQCLCANVQNVKGFEQPWTAKILLTSPLCGPRTEGHMHKRWLLCEALPKSWLAVADVEFPPCSPRCWLPLAFVWLAEQPRCLWHAGLGRRERTARRIWTTSLAATSMRSR